MTTLPKICNHITSLTKYSKRALPKMYNHITGFINFTKTGLPQPVTNFFWLPTPFLSLVKFIKCLKTQSFTITKRKRTLPLVKLNDITSLTDYQRLLLYIEESFLGKAPFYYFCRSAKIVEKLKIKGGEKHG